MKKQIMSFYSLWGRSLLLFCLCPLWAAGADIQQRAADKQPCLDTLRFNQLQYIATHNSYHIAPGQFIGTMLLAYDYQESATWPATRLVPALAYTHIPIAAQLALGIRAFELDIHHDPVGGKYASPGMLRLKQRLSPLDVAYDPGGVLRRPGFKVFHTADIDVYSTCLLLLDCLREIALWSDRHPDHLPIIIQLEAKEKTRPPVGDLYLPVQEDLFTSAAWKRLEQEILSVFPRDRIIAPWDVYGKHDSFRQAITEQGWPTVGKMRGKVLFVLLNFEEADNNVAVRYRRYQANIRHRLLFALFPPGDPEAGFIHLSDPFDRQIGPYLQAGFIVLTKADAHGKEARGHDTRMRRQAFASGAQLISTDYPFPNPLLSSYQVRFKEGGFVRAKPVLGQSCPP